MLPIDSFIVRPDYLIWSELWKARRSRRWASKSQLRLRAANIRPGSQTIKHWEQFDSMNLVKAIRLNLKLTNRVVPGYEDYQSRVGEVIKEQLGRFFWG